MSGTTIPHLQCPPPPSLRLSLRLWRTHSLILDIIPPFHLSIPGVVRAIDPNHRVLWILTAVPAELLATVTLLIRVRLRAPFPMNPSCRMPPRIHAASPQA